MPESTAEVVISIVPTCASASQRTRCPAPETKDRKPIWFAIVPVGTNSAASLPVISAARSWRRFTVGSSPYQSSPTSAEAIARRIASEGLVTVSERRSIGAGTARQYIRGVRRNLLPILLATVIVLWGGAFVAIRILVRDVSPLTIAFLRFVLTSIGLVVVTALARPEAKAIERADWPKLLLLGFCGVVVYHLALNYGEQYVSADLASLIVASMPVMVALLSRAFLREEVNATRWAGITLALAAVLVLTFLRLAGAPPHPDSLTGAAVVVLAPTAWAIYTVVSKPLVSKYGALRMTTYATVTGTR